MLYGVGFHFTFSLKSKFVSELVCLMVLDLSLSIVTACIQQVLSSSHYFLLNCINILKINDVF